MKAQKRLYMLVSGKVFLNSRSSTGRSVILDEVSSGRTIVGSALMGESHSAFTGICAEPFEIITISGQQLLELSDKDVASGHTRMLNLVASFRPRIKMRAQQVLKGWRSKAP